ncbi:MAG TPA: type II toxin-antitoxin system PemK/MazF family toxin [Verrucomicrobiae bacterium]|nr:type II toxin-antitoxin system PemK/MazF family toxin [Verrucomicrobiae bacterium]
MIQPKPGEVWWIDLGMKAKVRPMMVVSREDTHPERAISVCVPCTTAIRGGNYEVRLPGVRWMPGSAKGVANVLGISAVDHRFERRAGSYEPALIQAVRERNWLGCWRYKDDFRKYSRADIMRF